MKKGYVFTAIIIFMMFFCCQINIPIKTNLQVVAKETSFEDFQSQFNELVKDDDFETISIEEDEEINNLIDKLGNENTSQAKVLTASVEEKEIIEDINDLKVNEANINEICKNLELNYYKTADSYNFYSIYKFKRMTVIGQLKNSYGAKNVLTYNDYNILTFETEEKTKYAYEQLIKDDDLIVSLASIVTTSSYSYSSYVNEWGAQALDLGYYNEYLSTNNCGKDVVVAVLDTGINTNHQMFEDRLLKDSNNNIIGYSSVNSTYSGYTFEDDGWSDSDDDGTVDTPSGHGTHVSGIITGLTPENVKILPMKVLGHNGKGSTTGIESALLALTTAYANLNVVCANMSLGATYSSLSSANSANAAYEVLFNKLRNRNILPVVASGNDAKDSAYIAPAGSDNAITVSAVYGFCEYLLNPNDYDQNYTGEYYFDTYYSNYGDDVDFVAPGTWILSASIGSSTNSSNSKRLWMSGTSQATPHVSAVVALFCLDNAYYYENAPTYTLDEIEKRMQFSAVNFNNNGASLINCYGMVNLENYNGRIDCESTSTTFTYDGNYHNISLSINGVSDYEIYYGFTANEYSITDITTNNKFKNFTNGAMDVYYKIVADGYLDTKGVATLTINRAKITIATLEQTSIYGEAVYVDDSKYKITSGQIYGDDNLKIDLSTSAKTFSDAGSYDITATISNDNYSLSLIKGKYIVTPKTIGITLNDQTCVYGSINLNQNAYELSEQPYNHDNLNIKILSDEANSLNVGDNNKIDFTHQNGNYNLIGEKADLIITPRPIEIAIYQQVEYGKTFKLNKNNYSIQSSLGVVAGDDLKLKLVENFAFTDKGVYDVNIVAENANYNVTINSSKIEITAKPVTITIDSMSSVYGDSIDLSEIEYFLSSNFVNNDKINIKLITNATSKSLVGTYPITAQCSGDKINNYSLSVIDGILSITPRKVVVKIENQYIDYDEEISLKNLYSFVESSFVNNDNLNINLSVDAQKGDPIGRYLIKYTFDNDNKNYDIEFVDGYLYITEGTLNIHILSQTFVYGEKIVLDQSKYNVDVDIDRSILGITLTTNAKDWDDVGNDYVINGESSNNNYNIIIHSGVLEIVERPVSINLLNQEIEYGTGVLDQSKFILTDDISKTNIENDNVKISLKSDLNSKSIVNKTYPIEFEWQNKNYSVRAINSANVTIVKRKLTIESVQFATYGTNFEFNSKDYSIKNGNIVNGDDLLIKFATNATKFDEVGDYDLFVLSSNSNYEISLNNKSKFVLKAKDIKIEIYQEKYYGDEVLLDSSKIKIIHGEVVNNDSLNLKLSTTATNKSSVGIYNIIIEDSNKNYNITLVSGKLNVCKRLLKIETIKTGEYGSYFNLNNDYNIVEGSIAFETDDLNIKFETNANSVSPVGIYPLIMSYDNANYDVELKHSSIFQVVPRIIKVKIGNQTSQYGESVEVDQTNFEITSGEIINEDVLGLSLTTLANSSSKVGVYPIICIIDNSNYEVDYTQGEYEITKRQITIKLNNQTISRVEGFEIDQSAYEIIEGEVINADNLEFEIYSDVNSYSLMGDYKLMAKFDNENYDIKIVEAKLHLNISFVEIGIIIFAVGITALIILKVLKIIKAKRLRLKLFDANIKW